MSVLSMPSPRSSEAEFEQITQLAVSLSAQLTRVHTHELEFAIAAALQQVAVATGLDTCQLIEFSETGTVASTHAPTRTAAARDGPSLDAARRHS